MARRLWTFDEFLQMDVRRTRGTAEVIVDIFHSTPGDGFEEHEGKPVRLLGFTASAELSDFEILEAAFEHYKQLAADLK